MGDTIKVPAHEMGDAPLYAGFETCFGGIPHQRCWDPIKTAKKQQKQQKQEKKTVFKAPFLKLGFGNHLRWTGFTVESLIGDRASAIHMACTPHIRGIKGVHATCRQRVRARAGQCRTLRHYTGTNKGTHTQTRARAHTHTYKRAHTFTRAHARAHT